jgi:putative addiction module killer protein
VEVVPRVVDYYYTADGQAPFKEWLHAISDRPTRQIIAARLARVRRGLLGDSRFVGSGVWELRVDVGPGYRIYFGQKAPALVWLLCGGHKGTQEKDIWKAQTLWFDYLRRSKT